MPFLSILSNPLWRIKGLATYTPEAQAPTLWKFDSAGYASPSDGRQLGEAETAELAEYNSNRSKINAANAAAIDAVMGRLFPLTDGLFNDLSNLEALQLVSDLSYLNDHEAGSDFYNDSSNFEFASENGDEEGWARASRLRQLLSKAGLNVNDEPLQEKANSGISSPIIIDLGGDGIETTSFLTGNTVLFDVDCDGIKDKTAWISKKDAFLAVDKNGNGLIDGVDELFGGRERGDGFAKLADFDTNEDGVIDKNDKCYSALLLWQDFNGDGITDDSELSQASAAGLQSINTKHETQNILNNGNLLGEVADAVFNNRTVNAIDVYFRFSKGTLETESQNKSINSDSLVAAMSTFAPSGSVNTQNSLLKYSVVNLDLENITTSF
ncbi:hypothetical protein ACFX58_04720 [Sphingomonas sp. NCPPB 2930]